jgi:hypothetical protein
MKKDLPKADGGLTGLDTASPQSSAMNGEAGGSRRGTARLRADSSAAPARRNITLQLEESGAPKWESVTEKNRQAWREILAHPSTVEALGLTPGAGPALASPALPPAAPISAALDALAWAEAFACAKLIKVSFDEAVRVLTFSADEKALLIPPAQEVAAKYLGAALEKYGAESALALLLLSISLRKVEALRALPRQAGPRSNAPDESPEAEARVN